jgi:peptide/nickel transport system permease protein
MTESALPRLARESRKRAPVARRPLERLGVLRRVRNRPLAFGAGIALAALALVAVVGPPLSPYGPDTVSYELLRAPTFAHPLGTDDVGRDVLTRLLLGTRISLLIGMAIALLAVGVGTFTGTCAGYFGGKVDRVATSLIDLFLTLPILPVALVVAAFVPVTPQMIVLVFGGLSWMSVARLVRAEVYALKSREFVLAAIASGASSPRVIWVHLLPNAVAPLTVAGTLLVATGILLEASLSYLGFGVQLPTPSLGNMLQNAQLYIYGAPWLAIFPGACIFLIVMSVNLFGDGLREAFDPRLDIRG